MRNLNMLGTFRSFAKMLLALLVSSVVVAVFAANSFAGSVGKDSGGNYLFLAGIGETNTLEVTQTAGTSIIRFSDSTSPLSVDGSSGCSLDGSDVVCPATVAGISIILADMADTLTVSGGLGSTAVHVEALDTFAAASDDSITVSNKGSDRNVINAGLGADTIRTGSGNDTIFGDNGITGSPSDSESPDTSLNADTIDSGGGNDYVYGEGGNDTINDNAGSDVVFGGGNDDTFRATVSKDIGDCYYGDDPSGTTGVTSGTADTISYSRRGGTGSGPVTIAPVDIDVDAICGSDGDSGLDTEEDSVHFDVEVGVGGQGDDTFIDYSGASNSFQGGKGTDTYSYTRSDGVNATLNDSSANDGTDSSEDDNVNPDGSVENLTGSSGSDDLTGSSGVNKLLGGEGADTLDGQGGDDAIDGEDDDDTYMTSSNDGADVYSDSGVTKDEGDTIAYVGREDSVSLTLNSGSGDDGEDGEGDNVTGVENAFGGKGDDTIAGDEQFNFIAGGEGNDEITGGLESDALFGEAGADTFHAGDANDGLDYVVADPEVGEDGSVDVLDYGSRETPVVAFVSRGDDGSSETVSGEDTDGDPSTEGDFAEGDFSFGVEQVNGGSGNDYLLGSEDAQTLRGNDGDDQIYGAGTAESLEDVESDSLYGGAGNDQLFAVNTAADNVDCGEGPEDDSDSAEIDGSLESPLDTTVDCEDTTYSEESETPEETGTETTDTETTDTETETTDTETTDTETTDTETTDTETTGTEPTDTETTGTETYTTGTETTGTPTKPEVTTPVVTQIPTIPGIPTNPVDTITTVPEVTVDTTTGSSGGGDSTTTTDQNGNTVTVSKGDDQGPKAAFSKNRCSKGKAKRCKRARGSRKLVGTASDDLGVTKVQLNLVGKAKNKRCYAFNKAARAVRKKSCTVASKIWIPAQIVGSATKKSDGSVVVTWLKKVSGLKKGVTYTVRVKATDSTGHTSTVSKFKFHGP